MTLVRWTPFTELENMQRRFSRILDNTDMPGFPEADHWLPAMDIRETDKALLIQAELPGIDKKDVKVEVKDDVLAISGERKYENDVKEENVHRIERAYGHFFRSFSLPANVDTSKVDATMRNGVLEIRLQKQEGAITREVSIH